MARLLSIARMDIRHRIYDRDGGLRFLLCRLNKIQKSYRALELKLEQT